MSFVEQILCSHISYWRLSSRLQPLRSRPYNLLHKIVHFSCTCVQTFVSRLLASCFNACSLMFHVLHHFSQSLQSLVSRPTASHSFHWQRSSRLYFATAILSNSDSVLLWLKSDSEFPQSWDLSHCPSLTLYPFISFFPEQPHPVLYFYKVLRSSLQMWPVKYVLFLLFFTPSLL